MSIIYTITTDNPNTTEENHINNWPPQIEASDWYKKVCAKSFSVTEASGGILLHRSVRMLWFADQTEFESWVNTNRLTNSELIAALAEWKTTNNITITEQYFECPTYTPGIPGLLG